MIAKFILIFILWKQRIDQVTIYIIYLKLNYIVRDQFLNGRLFTMNR